MVTIRKPNHIFLVLEDNEETIGYSWVEIKHYPENPFKKAYSALLVHQISIEPHVRGRGYGTYFMEGIFRVAEENNLSKHELDDWTENNMARDFYQKQVFSINKEYVLNEVAPSEEVKQHSKGYVHGNCMLDDQYISGELHGKTTPPYNKRKFDISLRRV
jgi:ribosomal protein S18 acetylase RimI-like enzyme